VRAVKVRHGLASLITKPGTSPRDQG
jgi:hypothetical protein